MTVSGAHPPYTILGPCPCQGCGALVYWARSLTRHYGQVVPGYYAWREATGRVHSCAARRAA